MFSGELLKNFRKQIINKFEKTKSKWQITSKITKLSKVNICHFHFLSQAWPCLSGSGALWNNSGSWAECFLLLKVCLADRVKLRRVLANYTSRWVKPCPVLGIYTCRRVKPVPVLFSYTSRWVKPDLVLFSYAGRWVKPVPVLFSYTCFPFFKNIVLIRPPAERRLVRGEMRRRIQWRFNFWQFQQKNYTSTHRFTITNYKKREVFFEDNSHWV